MKTEHIVILLIFVGFAALEFFFTSFFRKPTQRGKDALVEGIGSFILLGFTQPMILLMAGLLTHQLLPESQNALATSPLLLQVLLLLIFDDMTQYWWHRASHSSKWLYELHRPHHDAEYMSVRIVYRNNLFYYVMMPGIWFSGALIYLGLGPVYAVYIMVKMLVIIAAHSDVRWDAPLYKVRWFSPVMWIIERTISTPATHSAHHGKHAEDGVTNYKGNYGNLLFFWDVLFGSAKITRRYPTQIGVENLQPVSVAHQLLWPLVRDRSVREQHLPLDQEAASASQHDAKAA